MILKRFNYGSGGWMRRWWNFHTRAWRDVVPQYPSIQFDSSYFPLISQPLPFLPITLFDFTKNADDAADARGIAETLNRRDKSDQWMIASDAVIGGFSEVGGEYIDNSNTSSNKDSDTPSFIRWSGVIDTSVGLHRDVKYSGFVALKSPTFFHGANLRGMYKYLEVTCRTKHSFQYDDGEGNRDRVTNIYRDSNMGISSDSSSSDSISDGNDSVTNTTSTDRLVEYNIDQDLGYGPLNRTFHVTVNLLSSIPQSNFAGPIHSHDISVDMDAINDESVDIDDLPFVSAYIPFSALDNTSRSNRLFERSLEDDKIEIDYITLTCKDMINYPHKFTFDLARIRAVNFYKGRPFLEMPKPALDHLLASNKQQEIEQ